MSAAGAAAGSDEGNAPAAQDISDHRHDGSGGSEISRQSPGVEPRGQGAIGQAGGIEINQDSRPGGMGCQADKSGQAKPRRLRAEIEYSGFSWLDGR